ncbi:MAG: NAD-dependent epimerase/dehydratase family protein, partial [Longimicrobiales bacterium]
MNALIFGASGMVGIEVLDHCLNHPRISKVVSIVRKPVGVQHAKLREVVHDNYLDYSALEGELRQSDVCFFCIGVYQNAVPRDKFWEITCDYVDRLIRAYERVKTDVTFCLFGASGADPTERTPIMFAKAKGRAERLLLESKLARKYIFRPGYIHPGRRKPQSQFSTWYMPPIYRLVPWVGIDAADLGKVMVNVG